MNLQLSLKKKWFEMTKAVIKTEDYREITPYWAKRFLLWQKEDLKVNITDSDIIDMCRELNECIDEEDVLYELDNWYLSFKKFNQNTMTLGYPKAEDKERILKLEHKGIEIRTGNTEWGAEPNKIYFVIKHGVIL